MSHDPTSPDPGEELSGSWTAYLARRARAGDQEQFAALFERIAPAVHAWAALRIRRSLRRLIDPEDVVQEIWCQAVRRFDSFDPGTTPFRAWLFTIAKFVLLGAFRRLDRRGSAAEAASEAQRAFPMEDYPETATSLSRRVARDEALQDFLRFARTMPREDLEILVLCGFEGLTGAEAGSRLALSEEAAGKRWQRLRARLRTHGVPAPLKALWEE